ncbi:MAG: hypothetical protein GOP50_11705 [Candidatus Heimdallarchaeota archaeon]|nr:hypothetical protein [Candidatus Heimdallarchaeota archaeon]
MSSGNQKKPIKIGRDTWRHRLLKELDIKKKKKEWLISDTNLTSFAVHSATNELIEKELIKKVEEKDEIFFMRTSLEYEVVEPKKKKNSVEGESWIDELLEETEEMEDKAVLPLHGLSLAAKHEQMINSSKNSIILINPFLDKNNLYDAIFRKTKTKTNVNMLLITRPTSRVNRDNRKIHQQIIDAFVDSENAKVFTNDYLHAKILLVDKNKSLISSMNFTRSAISSSKEFGIYTESKSVVNSIIIFINMISEDMTSIVND